METGEGVENKGYGNYYFKRLARASIRLRELAAGIPDDQIISGLPLWRLVGILRHTISSSFYSLNDLGFSEEAKKCQEVVKKGGSMTAIPTVFREFRVLPKEQEIKRHNALIGRMSLIHNNAITPSVEQLQSFSRPELGGMVKRVRSLLLPRSKSFGNPELYEETKTGVGNRETEGSKLREEKDVAIELAKLERICRTLTTMEYMLNQSRGRPLTINWPGALGEQRSVVVNKDFYYFVEDLKVRLASGLKSRGYGDRVDAILNEKPS